MIRSKETRRRRRRDIGKREGEEKKLLRFQGRKNLSIKELKDGNS